MWQRRALETTDGHDQTEYNRILKGLYLPGKPGKAFQDMAPWPYLPTVIDTGKEGDERRPTQPDKDLRRVRNGQLGIHPELTSKAWDTFNSNKARGIRNAYWMWHGQIKVRPERSPHRRNHVFDDCLNLARPAPPCGRLDIQSAKFMGAADICMSQAHRRLHRQLLASFPVKTFTRQPGL